MRFRYARHSSNLEALVKFYTDVIGLEILGRFQGHETYDGVFLGHPNSDWHLEFTSSKDGLKHTPDRDDLLVFYFHSKLVISSLIDRAKRLCHVTVQSKNPYWSTNGLELTDPDGFGIIAALRGHLLESNDALTTFVKSRGISSWDQLLSTLADLPYGRNSNRTDYSLVISESCGTCSSKHALAKAIASSNGVKGVKLILCMFRMSIENTPELDDVLTNAGLEYLPEAHCYLRVDNIPIDLTKNGEQLYAKIEKDIIHEIEIEADQVSLFKVKYHQDFLKKWLEEQGLPYKFDQLWQIREACISALEK